MIVFRGTHVPWAKSVDIDPESEFSELEITLLLEGIKNREEPHKFLADLRLARHRNTHGPYVIAVYLQTVRWGKRLAGSGKPYSELPTEAELDEFVKDLTRMLDELRWKVYGTD